MLGMRTAAHAVHSWLKMMGLALTSTLSQRVVQPCHRSLAMNRLSGKGKLLGVRIATSSEKSTCGARQVHTRPPAGYLAQEKDERVNEHVPAKVRGRVRNHKRAILPRFARAAAVIRPQRRRNQARANPADIRTV